MARTRMTQAVCAALVAATATLAYAADATNPPVKARQEAMETIGENMKLISEMAKGERAFDAAAASDAAATIAETAETVPTLFEERADDPESTAKPAIWEDYGAFTEKVEALEAAAGAAEMGSLEALQGSLMEIGKTCKSCHDDFREKT